MVSLFGVSAAAAPRVRESHHALKGVFARRVLIYRDTPNNMQYLHVCTRKAGGAFFLYACLSRSRVSHVHQTQHDNFVVGALM